MLLGIIGFVGHAGKSVEAEVCPYDRFTTDKELLVCLLLDKEVLRRIIDKYSSKIEGTTDSAVWLAVTPFSSGFN